MERWSILSEIVKYVQYNQHSLHYYGLEVKAPKERSSTQMYKNLHDGEREDDETSLI